MSVDESLQIQTWMAWRQTLQSDRYRQPKRLLQFGYKVYSQNDEDGILAEIIRRLNGNLPRTFIEFGVQDGLECNTLRLLLDGWTGLWLDGNEAYIKQIQQHAADWISGKKLQVSHSLITAANVNQIFEAKNQTGELGLLSIDIDGNDIWVWEAVTVVRPAIVAIEYNATWAPPLSIVQPSDASLTWQGTSYFGASLSAIAKIADKKGYSLVGCSFSGVNAFFVRNDLIDGQFHEPFTAEEHYEPARYWMRHLSAGHRPGLGPLVTV